MKQSYFPEWDCIHTGTEEGMTWEHEHYVQR